MFAGFFLFFSSFLSLLSKAEVSLCFDTSPNGVDKDSSLPGMVADVSAPLARVQLTLGQSFLDSPELPCLAAWLCAGTVLQHSGRLALSLGILPEHGHGFPNPRGHIPAFRSRHFPKSPTSTCADRRGLLCVSPRDCLL